MLFRKTSGPVYFRRRIQGPYRSRRPMEAYLVVPKTYNISHGTTMLERRSVTRYRLVLAIPVLRQAELLQLDLCCRQILCIVQICFAVFRSSSCESKGSIEGERELDECARLGGPCSSPFMIFHMFRDTTDFYRCLSDTVSPPSAICT